MSPVQFALVNSWGGSAILCLSHSLALFKAKSVNLKVVLCPVFSCAKSEGHPFLSLRSSICIISRLTGPLLSTTERGCLLHF